MFFPPSLPDSARVTRPANNVAGVAGCGWRHVLLQLAKVSAVGVVARREARIASTCRAVIEGSHKLKHRLVTIKRVRLAGMRPGDLRRTPAVRYREYQPAAI
jgi:hypothetical protein